MFHCTVIHDDIIEEKTQFLHTKSLGFRDGMAVLFAIFALDGMEIGHTVFFQNEGIDFSNGDIGAGGCQLKVRCDHKQRIWVFAAVCAFIVGPGEFGLCSICQ